MPVVRRSLGAAGAFTLPEVLEPPLADDPELEPLDAVAPAPDDEPELVVPPDVELAAAAPELELVLPLLAEELVVPPDVELAAAMPELELIPPAAVAELAPTLDAAAAFDEPPVHSALSQIAPESHPMNPRADPRARTDNQAAFMASLRRANVSREKRARGLDSEMARERSSYGSLRPPLQGAIAKIWLSPGSATKTVPSMPTAIPLG
jgi:hypothetical protein